MTRATVLLLAVWLTICPVAAECFPEIELAQQIFLVTPASKASFNATLRILNRDPVSGSWLGPSTARRAVIGARGIAWSQAFSYFAIRGEPLKVEGDKKTPAGLFRIKSAFGVGESSLPNYVKLERGQQFCVDDVRSELYNTVVPNPASSLHITGEDMPRIPVYKRGLFIDYPTNREKRGGSCIFVHIWGSDTTPTSGCVALSEFDVADLQNRTIKKDTILAILPDREADMLMKCLRAP